MSELSRNIFISSRFEDLTYEEIAAKYGVSPRKVKREIQKSLEILRVSLKDYLPLILAITILQPTEMNQQHDNLDSIVNEIILHSMK